MGKKPDVLQAYVWMVDRVSGESNAAIERYRRIRLELVLPLRRALAPWF